MSRETAHTEPPEPQDVGRMKVLRVLDTPPEVLPVFSGGRERRFEDVDRLPSCTATGFVPHS